MAGGWAQSQDPGRNGLRFTLQIEEETDYLAGYKHQTFGTRLYFYKKYLAPVILKESKAMKNMIVIGRKNTQVSRLAGTLGLPCLGTPCLSSLAGAPRGRQKTTAPFPRSLVPLQWTWWQCCSEALAMDVFISEQIKWSSQGVQGP